MMSLINRCGTNIIPVDIANIQSNALTLQRITVTYKTAPLYNSIGERTPYS